MPPINNDDWTADKPSGKQHEPASSVYKESRPKTIPLRSDNSPLGGPIEAIDLTGDIERAISSSGTADFGEPRRLWTEEAASREEPREKRGKKRKSDEYTSDLLSPSKYKANPTTARKQDRHDSSVTRKCQHKRVIADSDDEDLFDWLGDDADVDGMMLDDSKLYPKLPQISAAGDQRESAIQASSVPHSAGPKHVSPQLLPSKPPQTEGNVVAKDFGRSQLSPSPKSGSQVKNQSVLKFLALPPDSLEQSTAQLKSALHKNAEIVYQQAMEGQQVPELIAENKTLVSRIQAIEQLQAHRDAHEKCLSRKDDLKQTLMQAISQGLDPTTMPEELAKSRAVEAEVEKIEAQICQILPQANILELAKDSRIDCPASSAQTSRKEPSTSHTKATPNIRSTRFETGNLAHDNVEACISRNMGSPLLDEMDFDIDWDTGDDDMLEAAETIEDRRTPVREQTGQSRKVFAETSGNASRVPSAKKSPGRSAFWSHHPWSQDVRTALKDRFHLRGFRPNQLEAIDATLGGKDTFILMPTGGGKSLCYQLPSVVTSGTTKGVTIVVSPLLSLMQDQVAHMRKLHIKAFLMNGESSVDERQWMLGQLSNAAGDEIELLYITPEMINKNQALVRALEKLHRRQRLARIVIDEAHCVSQWGHDFRPDYKELGEVRAKLPGVPLMALTATATENVKVDVMHNLKMGGCEVFLQSFNRPNLTYEVRAKGKNDEVLASIAETITSSYRNQCGIVYCLSRKTCEKVAKDLREKYNLKAEHYHAGVDGEKKAQVQSSWQKGQCHVIVATIAFGMGIDKPDVRFVIHHSIPKSLEGYYQETGRAGRDGKRSGCYLYYGYRDTATLKRMIEEGEGNAQQKVRQKQMLRNVVQFCENRSDCRRVQVLAYFGEYFRREDCNSSCDNCKSDLVFEVHDFSQHASWAIKIVRHFEELEVKVTVLYCVDLLRGELRSPKSPAHRRLPWYGKGSDLERGEIERLFYRLLGEDALSEDNVVNDKGFPTQYIKLGRRASAFEAGQRQMKLQVRVSPNAKRKAAPPAQKSKTGTAYPQSTMVSSPIQAAHDRRLARSHQRTLREEDSSDDSGSDGFEPLRVAGKRPREQTNQLGPPITRDQKMDQLDHLHRAVVEDFEVTAKRFLQDVRTHYNDWQRRRNTHLIHRLSWRKDFAANRSRTTSCVIWPLRSLKVKTTDAMGGFENANNLSRSLGALCNPGHRSG